MANTRVLLKKSSVASRVPTTNDLEYGEVAINYADGRLYYKDSSNNIKYFLESTQLSTASTLDDVTTNGSSTTNSVTVGGLSIGSAYTLPTSDGTANQVLSTDGSGNLTFVDQSGGSSSETTYTYTRFLFSIVSTESSLSGVDDNNNTLAYDSSSVEVYQNGIKLVAGDDFTATDGVSISFTDAVLNGDTVEVVTTGVPVSTLATNNIDENTATTTTTISNQVIDTWSSTTYRTAKYILQAVNGSDVHSTEILLNHNQSDVFITEYATIYSNNSLFTVSAQINSGNLELIVTPTNTNTTFDLVRTLLVARSGGLEGDLSTQTGSEDLQTEFGSEDLN